MAEASDSMAEASDSRVGAGGSMEASGSGLSVEMRPAMQVAALRYFSAEGAFARAVRESAGAALPSPLQAVAVPASQETAFAAELVLAWCRPTETLCLTESAARLSQLRGAVAGMEDGCLVELTSGLQLLRVRGERIAPLLCRLGGYGSAPEPGEARRSRLADVPVLALSLRPAETLLVVDRVYLPHLLGWVRETLRDFAAA